MFKALPEGLSVEDHAGTEVSQQQQIVSLLQKENFCITFFL